MNPPISIYYNILRLVSSINNYQLNKNP